MLLFTWIIDVVFRSMKCVYVSRGGGCWVEMIACSRLYSSFLQILRREDPELRKRKIERNGWRCHTVFLRILKVQPKKTLRTYYFPLLPTSTIPFFMILGFIFQDYLQMVCSVLSQSLPSTFLFLPGERYHRDQCQRPLLQTLTQKAHSRPLEASICFTNVRLGDITRC